VTVISIRCAKINDIDQYFRWVNETQTRENSISTEAISFETHKTWFYKKLQSTESYLYVVEKQTRPIGQVRFDLNSNSAKVSFSLDESRRGTGLATEMLDMAIKKLCSDNQSISYIEAVVKKDNIPSNRIFSTIGFILTEFRENSGLNIYRMELSLPR
jgi:UDP-2,4-diacetamido-2,4,6-trideoxy-beta-L-altropyranose hydrolase